jgi:uncharacterized repeat protein (TIGR01451 family)
MAWTERYLHSNALQYVRTGRTFGRARPPVVTPLLVAVAALCLLPAAAPATGTPACTEITNRATATYNIGDAVFVQESNPATTTVARLIDVNVVWQDAAEVVVAPGDTNRVLTFLVTNTGNADDALSLAGLSALGGDDFDPLLRDIYLDADGDGIWDPVADVRYLPGINDPVLEADGSVVVFVFNDIPLGLNDGALGNSELAVTSNTATGPPGTVLPGGSPCDADAVIGESGGHAADTGTYIVSSVSVAIAKSAAVSDPYGGSTPMPGAMIRYSLSVTVSGSGTAEDLVVTDPVPDGTTYSGGTLTLDGVPLTDWADEDPGDVGATTPGTVTVALGDVTAPAPTQTITFDVLID